LIDQIGDLMSLIKAQKDQEKKRRQKGKERKEDRFGENTMNERQIARTF
jgi:hypothetical protein